MFFLLILLSLPLLPHFIALIHVYTFQVSGQAPLPIKKGTLAVLYSGDLREWSSLVDNNIEYVFEHIAANFAIDVYMMPKLARETSNPTTVVGFGEGLKKIKRFLRYFMVEEADFSWDQYVRPPIGCTPPLLPGQPDIVGGWTHSFYHQFISVYRIYQEIKRQETIQGWRYEWLIRSRMDMRWSAKPEVKLITLDTSKIHVAERVVGLMYTASVSDHFAIMHANIADGYLAAGNKIFQGKWCHTKEYFDPYCHVKNMTNTPPECLLARWLVDNGTQWQQHRFSFDIHKKRRLHQIDNNRKHKGLVPSLSLK